MSLKTKPLELYAGKEIRSEWRCQVMFSDSRPSRSELVLVFYLQSMHGMKACKRMHHHTFNEYVSLKKKQQRSFKIKNRHLQNVHAGFRMGRELPTVRTIGLPPRHQSAPAHSPQACNARTLTWWATLNFINILKYILTFRCEATLLYIQKYNFIGIVTLICISHI